MDRRLQVFPALPSKVPLVLPTKGDLRLRVLLPQDFLSHLHIHADARNQLRLYLRFQVLRKFLVMSTDGDLFTQTLRTELTLRDLPKQQLLPLPLVADGDIVEVLDLVQCFSEQYRAGRGLQNITWELVRVRWRNGLETWMPVEIVQSRSAELLQKFYVNSINSWQKIERLQRHNLTRHKTEVEMWLQHNEFRKFFRQLQKRHRHRTVSIYNVNHLDYARLFPTPAPTTGFHDRKEGIISNASTPTNASGPANVSITSTNNGTRVNGAPTVAQRGAPAQAVLRPTGPSTASTNSNSIRESTSTPQPAEHLRRTGNEPQQHVSAIRSKPTSSSAQVRENHQQQPQRYSPAKQKALTTPSQKQRNRKETSEPSEDSQPLTKSQKKKKRKRLRYWQTTIEDESPDRPSEKSSGLDASELDTVNDTSTAQTEATTTPTDLEQPRARIKKRKRLRQFQVIEDSDDDDVLPELGASSLSSSPPTNQNDAQTTSLPDVFSDIARETELSQEPTSQGTPTAIRCVCGATTIDRYTGQWLQCWNEDCGVWEHAECVGCLLDQESDPSINYLCSKCDNDAYQTRVLQAKDYPVKWIEQCCDTYNTRFLLYLLKSIWDPEEHERLAMRVMKTGLLKCVDAVLCNEKFNIFATDNLSRNVLHHCAMGESPRVFAKVYDFETRLLTHQDRGGQTPFHYLLRSQQLNSLCVALLRFLPRLAVESDYFDKSPLHFAMEAITDSTVGIVQEILELEPGAILAKTLDGITPLMLLYQSQDLHHHEKTVRGIMAEILRVDFLGASLNEKDENGWTVLQHAASMGNCDVLLGTLRPSQALLFMDLNLTIPDSDQTALHLAAACNDAIGVRRLLSMGFDPLAIDADGLIPLFHACCREVIRELLTCVPDMQLMRLVDRLDSFKWKEKVKSILRMAVRDEECFFILNDFFARKWTTPDGIKTTKCLTLLTESRYLLTIANKLKFVKCVCDEFVMRNPTPASSRLASTKHLVVSKKTCWDDLVAHFRQKNVAAFRYPLTFAFADDRETTFSSQDLTQMIVLRNWVLRAVSRRRHRLFTRQKNGSVPLMTPTPANAAMLDQLILLGAFVAHLVLFGYCVGIKFDLHPQFLLAVAALDSDSDNSDNSMHQLAAQMFGFGFEQVLPGMLDFFDDVELRVLLYARRAVVDAAKLIASTTAIDFESEERKTEVISWFSRLVNELADDARMILVLQLTGTAALVLDDFACFLDHSASKLKKTPREFPEAITLRPLVATSSSQASQLERKPQHIVVEKSTFTLCIPRFETYEAFRADMMDMLVRRCRRAFLPS